MNIYIRTDFSYEEARTEIQLLFGLKINKAFPRKYLESDSCGGGFYRSTGKGNYQHPGVDAEVQAGTEVCQTYLVINSLMSFFSTADVSSLILNSFAEINQTKLLSSINDYKCFFG